MATAAAKPVCKLALHEGTVYLSAQEALLKSRPGELLWQRVAALSEAADRELRLDLLRAVLEVEPTHDAGGACLPSKMMMATCSLLKRLWLLLRL